MTSASLEHSPVDVAFHFDQRHNESADRNLGVPNLKQPDFVNVTMAEQSVVKITPPKRRVNPTSNDSTKRRKREVRPPNSIRYDDRGHWPEIDSVTNATRCKNENCTKKSHILCSKCKVHLCLVEERNCFKAFHIL